MLTILTVPAGITSSSITVTTDVLYNIYGTANSFTIQTGGSMTVFATGSANSTYVQKGAGLFVSEGGHISQTELQDGALLNGFTVGSSPYKLDSVIINSATVEGGASAYVFSGQQASGILVSSAAILHVSRGGTVSGVSAAAGATVNLLSGITATNVTLDSGVVLNGFTLEEKNTNFAVIAGATVASGMIANVYSGRTVNSAAVNSGASVFVSTGGAMSATANAGYLTVSEGGRLYNVTNSATLNMNGGTAYRVDNAGEVYVSRGLVESFTQSAGILHVDNSGFISSAMISGGSVVVSGGGSMNTAQMTGGSMFISGGVVENFSMNTALLEIGNVVRSNGKFVGSVSGVLSNAVIGSAGSVRIQYGKLLDVTVQNSGTLIAHEHNYTFSNLVLSSGAVFSADGDNHYSNTTILSGAVVNGFTAMDTNIVNSGLLHKNVVVHSAGSPAELFSGEQVSKAIVKSGGVIHVGIHFQLPGTVSAGELTVESGGSVAVDEDCVLVLNGKTKLNEGGGIVLSRHIIHYTDFYSNAVDVFNGNVGTSCYSPVAGSHWAVISGTSYTRASAGAEWDSGTKISAYTIDPFVRYVDYSDNYDGGNFSSHVQFIPLTGSSSDGLSKISGGGVVSSVVIVNAGGSQARVRFDFTSASLAPNEAMLNDISRVSVQDTGVDSSTLVPNQYHDDPRFEFVYNAALKDAYYIADGAEGFGNYYYSIQYPVVYSETFRIVDANGNPSFPNQLNVGGNIVSWNNAGTTVSAHLQREESHLYMELYRTDSSTRAEIFVPAEFTTSHPYFLTSDTKFAADKTYYTLAGGVYTSAAVTSGTVIPADTYYEKQYTNADVVVTAQFSQNTRFGTKKYDLAQIGDPALNNQDYKVYQGVTFAKNGQVTFKGTGADGQAAVDSDNTGVNNKTVVIDWIDKLAPVITVSQKPAGTGQVTVFAEASDVALEDESFACSGFDSQTGIEYRLNDEADWTAYTDTGVTVGKGDVVHFQAYDMAGNRGEQDHTAMVFELTASATKAGTTEWTSGNATITVDDIEGTSEVFQYSYSLDKGKTWTAINKDAETNTYHFDVGVNADVSIRAVHEKFAPEDNPLTTSITVDHVDKVDPVIDKLDWNKDLTADPVTVTVSASDTLSGVKKIEYQFNGGAWTEIDYTAGKTDGSFTLSESGNFTVRVTDNVGNSAEQDGTVNIDISTITFSCAPANDSEHWTNQDVTVTVSASYAASEVAKIEYSLDSGASWTEITYTTEKTAGTFTLTEAGDFTIRSTSTRPDFFAEETGTAYIDKLAPVIDSVSWDTAWTNQDVTVTVSVSDDLSGVAKTEYSVAGGAWTEFTNTFSMTQNGSFKVRAADKAGNVVQSDDYQITNIDKVDPTMSLAVSTETDWYHWTNQDVTVTVSASDKLSGVAKIEYTFEGSAWKDITDTRSFTLSEFGAFGVRVTDRAGNYVEQGGTVFIDKGQPTMSLAVSTETDWYHWTQQDVTVTVSASASDDSLCGVAKIEYTFEGSAWQDITAAGSFTLSKFGAFGVRVTDRAGNYVEQGGTVFIDKDQPVIDSISWNQAWTDRPVTVTVSAHDETSYVEKTEYSFNGGEWTEFNDSFVIDKGGSFKVRATDKAGNVTESPEQKMSNITHYTIEREPDTGPYAAYDIVVDATGDYVFTGDFGNVSGTITVTNNYETVSGTIQQGVLDIGTENTVSLVAGPVTIAVEVQNGSLYVYGLCIDKVLPADVGLAGDLNADGRADIVMSITQAGHGAEGATGAWLIQEDQLPVWDDLSQRNAGWEIFGTGKTVAGKNTDDVYLRNTDNVVGAWTTGDDGKVNGWKTVGEFPSDAQVLGIGDFNGSGQSDLLLRAANGAVGCFFADGRGWNYFQSLGDEWKLAAIGDLNGDGRDDVVLKHDAGFAGSWLIQEDGTPVWADLDTLPNGFEVVGAGDFNGDGTDDVLLNSGSYYGAWLVQNGNAAGWMGLGDFGGAVVEQIGDFNGDGVDDLRIRTSAGDLGAELVMGADTLDWKYYGSVGAEWSTSLAALS